jgi:hypothetical protein
MCLDRHVVNQNVVSIVVAFTINRMRVSYALNIVVLLYGCRYDAWVTGHLQSSGLLTAATSSKPLTSCFSETDSATRVKLS